ncbi:NAD(P)-dependent oxidoreductase [Methylobacterium segetis]|uniref:NAD(P)-dependent oxidoreductase n=1 Tax=Methylobacterium segetis TaxID=2488750 RepID=UPI0010465E7C|nr:NAD(P)-dependent oxidoreductase [Methylobacterium segetis]
MRALIGYTGFVGANMLQRGSFDALYNSVNSAEMRGRHFAEVVCSGVSAVKWKANKDPEGDKNAIDALIGNLQHLRADRFVLISTVDIYSRAMDVDEDTYPEENTQAYGRNRRYLERWVEHHFGNHHIIRLPALYGTGLKKNAIYDLCNGKMVDQINPLSEFQWYDVRRLNEDLQHIILEGGPIFNISPEPVAMMQVVKNFFPRVSLTSSDVPPVKYDVQTKFSRVLGGSGKYHFSVDQVLKGIGNFVANGI